MNLTDNQKKIVEYTEGPILVKAGPGSGKTRVLTERIIRLLRDDKKRILALTFSNKAAEEIKERIQKKLGDDILDDVYVGTIHSFCLKVINDNGHLIGIPNNLTIFEKESDRIDILKSAINESLEIKTQLFEENKNNDFLKKTLERIANHKRNFETPDMLENTNDKKERLFVQVYRTYNNMMLSQNAIDFEDILLYAYILFTTVPKVARRYVRVYRYVFVDEAQDLNISQYNVIRSFLNDYNNVMFVGDPEQSIYKFNGSDSTIMEEKFVNDFNPKIFIINENFRSSKKIIEASKKINVNIETDIKYPIDGVFEIKKFETQDLEADWIVSSIKDLLENGSSWIEKKVKTEDIAIIARNRYVFNSIEEKLKKYNIEYNFGQQTNSLESESEIMKKFEEGLKIIINPNDELHYKNLLRLLNLDFEVEGQNSLEKIFNLKIEDEEIKKEYEVLKEIWELLSNNEEEFSLAIKKLKLLINKEFQFDDENRFLIENDLEMWNNHWQNYVKNTIVGQRTLAQFKNQVALGMTQNYKRTGISLLTVHMSKGLEFEVVFIVGVNEGVFPDYRSTSKDKLIEEKNNMFVAITRAKRICYVTYPKLKMMPWGQNKKQTPSIFIYELNKDIE